MGGYVAAVSVCTCRGLSPLFLSDVDSFAHVVLEPHLRASGAHLPAHVLDGIRPAGLVRSRWWIR